MVTIPSQYNNLYKTHKKYKLILTKFFGPTLDKRAKWYQVVVHIQSLLFYNM